MATTAMGVSQPGLGQRVAQLAIRTGIAVGGLLLIQLILSAFPLGNPIYPTASSLTASSATATASGQQPSPGALDPRQMALELGSIVAQSLSPQLRAETLQAWASSHVFIFPVTIADAVLDTVVLILLLRFGLQLGDLMRRHNVGIPALTKMIFPAVALGVAAIAYAVYQGIALPLLGFAHQGIYDWLWLAVGAVPMIALVTIVTRNLDAISSGVFRGAQVAIAGRKCNACGAELESGLRFCPGCGAATAAAPAFSAPTVRRCAACGNALGPASRFCGKCGQTAPLPGA